MKLLMHGRTPLPCNSTEVGMSEMSVELVRQYKVKHNQLIEALDALEDMVRQDCRAFTDETIDNSYCSATAFAMRVLHKHGRLQITQDSHRRVIGKWVAKEE